MPKNANRKTIIKNKLSAIGGSIVIWLIASFILISLGADAVVGVLVPIALAIAARILIYNEKKKRSGIMAPEAKLPKKISSLARSNLNDFKIPRLSSDRKLLADELGRQYDFHIRASNETSSVLMFFYHYDCAIEDLEKLCRLQGLANMGYFIPEFNLRKAKEDFQWHLCDAIAREKSERIQNIQTKYINSKEFQEKEALDFENIIEWNKGRLSPKTRDFANEAIEELKRHAGILQSSEKEFKLNGTGYDPLLLQAADVIFETKSASVSMIQRRLKIGYSEASRIMDRMEEAGIVGPFVGSEPRKILITRDQWLLTRNQRIQTAASLPPTSEKKEDKSLDMTPFVQDEEEWRREQRRMSPLESELYKIDHMEGHDFEDWCADLLRKNGFENVQVTPGSNDQGVDILAENGGVKYAIQCKRYSTDPGNKPVQEVIAGKAIYNCHVGAVMTNRYFTQGGKDAAAATGVLLWDRDKLVEMIAAQ